MLSETQSGDSGPGLSPEVSTLVDYIWTEANGQLRDVLAVPVESVKVEQVDKAEAELLTIKRLLSDGAMEKSKKGALVWSFGQGGRWFGGMGGRDGERRGVGGDGMEEWGRSRR